ncbi:MAG: hypothetical protein JST75_18740 [Bacteroidetes bacterium]|nr:hypothetical protein [Bacteroidota bacterium]
MPYLTPYTLYLTPSHSTILMVQVALVLLADVVEPAGAHHDVVQRNYQ